MSNFRFPHLVSSTRVMTFDLSWALMRLRGPVKSWDGRSFEAVDILRKVGNQLL